MIGENKVRLIVTVFCLLQLLVYRCFAYRASTKLEEHFDREKEEFGFPDDHFSKQRDGIQKLLTLLNYLLGISLIVMIYATIRYLVSG